MKRTFPTHAEKVLDAPDIKDDYYLNLLDWGSHGILAVSLANSVYLLKPQGDIVQLMTISESSYISSVNWMPNSDILAIGNSEK